MSPGSNNSSTFRWLPSPSMAPPWPRSPACCLRITWNPGSPRQIAPSLWPAPAGAGHRLSLSLGLQGVEGQAVLFAADADDLLERIALTLDGLEQAMIVAHPGLYRIEVVVECQDGRLVLVDLQYGGAKGLLNGAERADPVHHVIRVGGQAGTRGAGQKGSGKGDDLEQFHSDFLALMGVEVVLISLGNTQCRRRKFHCRSQKMNTEP